MRPSASPPSPVFFSRALAVATLLCAGAARASEPASPVHLAWDAPAGCPGQSQVLADVASLIGDTPPSTTLEAEGTVSQAPTSGAWTLRLSTGSGPARRSRVLSAPSCDALAKAAAAVLAIQVSPTAALRASDANDDKGSSSPPASPPRSPTVPAPLAEDPTDTERPQALRTSSTEGARGSDFAIAALAGGSLGAVGNPAAALAGALAWLPGPWRLEVFGLWSPLTGIDHAAGVSGKFTLLTFGARGCWTLGARVGLGVCGGAEGGQVAATGSGANVVEPTTQRRAWFAASAGGLLTLREGPLAFRVQLDAVAPLVRENFVIEGGEVVHTPWVVGPRMLAGVELRFP